jgi:hypothetical protein
MAKIPGWMESHTDHIGVNRNETPVFASSHPDCVFGAERL